MELDLKKLKLRAINEKLQNLDRKKNERDFKIINPEGSHALCAGLTENMNINVVIIKVAYIVPLYPNKPVRILVANAEARI